MTHIAHNLNPFPCLMLLSALLAAALIASPRLHAAEAGYSATHRSLTIACDNRYISQHQASWLLDTGNFSQTYDRRAALHAEIARACMAGVAAVRVEGKRANLSIAQLSQR